MRAKSSAKCTRDPDRFPYNPPTPRECAALAEAPVTPPCPAPGAALGSRTYGYTRVPTDMQAECGQSLELPRDQLAGWAQMATAAPKASSGSRAKSASEIDERC
jgi:hypothetical protein